MEDDDEVSDSRTEAEGNAPLTVEGLAGCCAGLDLLQNELTAVHAVMVTR